MKRQRKEQPDVVVAGAGFAGTVIARELAEAGKHVLLLEKREHIGGNMYDEKNADGILIHRYGPHIFHTNDAAVYEYVRRFGTWMPYYHQVRGKIGGKEVPIPFNFQAMEQLFPAEKVSRLQQKLRFLFRERKRVSVMELLECSEKEIAELGQFVYDFVFAGYTAKQWGVPVDQVDRSVINRVPVVLGYENGYFADVYQLMPQEGYTSIFETMLRHPRIQCCLGTDAQTRITLQENGTIWLDGTVFHGVFVYTGMPDELLHYRYGTLPYRSLDLQFETLELESAQSVGVVNYPNSEAFTRITEFKKLTGQKKSGITTILREYPTAFARQEGQEAYYPIENPENRARYERYRTALATWNQLYLCGRLAEYRYYNMDGVVARALQVSQEILERKSLSNDSRTACLLT